MTFLRAGGMWLAHNAESLKIILCGRPIDLYICHAGAGRTLPAPCDELVKFFMRPFRYGFDRTVRAISYPAGEVKILRFVNGRSAEVNPLNPAMDRHMNANRIVILCHRAIFYRARGEPAI